MKHFDSVSFTEMSGVTVLGGHKVSSITNSIIGEIRKQSHCTASVDADIAEHVKIVPYSELQIKKQGDDIQVLGSHVNILEGAVVTNVIVSYGDNEFDASIWGTLYVKRGATLSHVTINNGGQLVVFEGATVEHVVVKNGGEFQITKGATANDVTIEEGGLIELH